ncbi:Bifunctional inhibitor/plant lipid transfer protein/seed storage helical domain [Arabidopsis suecica]|uniref:Bifunctional inhibitor/lipid-transfer protein/seed storage 2S albumin superfamily protein n=2 Tax=Arabidopsis TaxID=3701 RepID=A8MRP3_ARATH|nr:Bifunctional inhibitor/lipid-transfer protein/seed storage 2S albumin superfamily protein [Arabidopsis thaliana]AEE28175.1 Bifunctional inhibitor/lipid-transfer protein/seed storage 2S albumin superfamily protein [Arabidopsis thaliana]KAG7596205.1 Bifunctional inhibitor/plant lipid transfer protein/seed storage helical domain [Arabidopsis suecica]|eukprot:NP_001077480.1 Bifunctional inhibitor/lipid-transfer protein/seed storage 2S albumin superfamily protein [Arabidopsis thaliana]
MKMKFTTLVFVAFVLSSMAPTKAEEKAACVVTDLKACLPDIIGETPPSTKCCTKLKDKKSCFCEYLKNPLIAPYMTSAKQVLEACGVPVPVCQRF